MAQGFMGGFESSQNQFLQRQGEQLRQALMIADQIQQQEQVAAQKEALAYKKEQDKLDREWEKDPNNPKNVSAKTNEAWRKSSEQRQKERDHQQDIEDADVKGTAMFDKGHQFPVAYARLKKLDPDLYAEKEREVFEGYRQSKRAEHDAKLVQPAVPYEPPSMVAPQLPEAPFSPAQPAAQPPPFMQSGMGALPGPLGAMGQMMQPPQGAPPPMGPPGVSGQASAGPQLPPMMVGGERPPFMEPTMQEAISQPSPAFLMMQQKLLADAALKAARKDVLERGMALREELDPIRLQAKIDADYNRAEIARMREDREQTFVDAKIHDMKEKIIHLDRNYRRQIKLDDSLVAFRTAMTSVAHQNAATRERTAGTYGPKAMREYAIMQGHTSDEEKRANDLENMAAQAKVNMETSLATWGPKNQQLLNTPPSDTGLLGALTAEVASEWEKARQNKARYSSLIIDAKRARANAATLRHLADTMKKEMVEKGVGAVVGQKQAPRVRPLPPAPRSRVDEAAKLLGIP